jgi:PAS domain S-box-containing protein
VGSTGESFEAGQCAVLERVAAGAPLPEVLADIVTLIERHAPDALCSILLIDGDRLCVRLGAAPRLPPEFMAGLDGLKIGANAGSCGAAAHRRERVIVEDIATHPYWTEYRHLAKPHNLAACWSSPIFSPQRETLGTFAIYYREPRGPSEHELRLVDTATHLAAVAIVRERSQRALEASEERLRAVIENTPDVAIQWYDEAGRLLFINQASDRILGLGPNALGKTLLELGFWTPEEEDRFALMRAAAVRGQAVAPVEFHFRRPAGDQGVLLSTVFRIPYSGRDSCTVCMDVDLSERRRLERELSEAQRLTALGALAAGVAHDFNNLLTAIQGNIGFALKGTGSPAEVEECLLAVEQAGTRAATLVRQMLTFGRKQETRRTLGRLRPVIEEVLALLRASVPKSIALHATFAPDTPAVELDASQVHQVIVNLVNNAAQAIGARAGAIAIDVGPCTVSASTPHAGADIPLGEYVQVQVHDDGPGMDDETSRRVFEPFFTTKRDGEGTGLGLSVVHGIMKSHQGGVGVESQPGHGTTFRLYFPTPRGPRANGRQASGLRLLLVDGDEALLHLAQRVLSRRGHDVTLFTDPALALAELRARPRDFDVLVTDVSMPTLSGPDFIARVRELRAAFPVVMTSGRISPEVIEAARRLGNVHVVPKPPSVDGYIGLVAPFEPT